MKALMCIVLILAGAAPAATLLEDDFEDGDAIGWTELTNWPDSASYYVQDGWYHMEITKPSGYVFALSGDDQGSSPWQMTVPDYSVVTRVKAWEGTSHLGVVVRMQHPVEELDAYVLWLRFNWDDIQIHREFGGAYEVLAEADYPLDFEVPYWMRFEVFGGQLRGKVWQGDLSDEPVDFNVSASDASYAEPGSVGMGCHSFSGGLKHVAFDHVIVTDTGYSMEAMTWGGIKGSF